jgi:small subunit ribosomal protein S4
MKRSRKKYERPLKIWDKEKILEDREIMKSFGLKKKMEIWRTEGFLRKFRRMARELEAKKDKEKEKVLLRKLINLGVLNEGATLDDVLGLSLKNFLDRRLETIIFSKSLANSAKQSRQFITHGHVSIGGKKITYPSYLVLKNEENNINVKIVPSKPKVSASER